MRRGQPSGNVKTQKFLLPGQQLPPVHPGRGQIVGSVAWRAQRRPQSRRTSSRFATPLFTVASPFQFVCEPVGAALEGADYAAQCLVLGNGDIVIGPGLLVELPQQVCQQWKRVTANGLIHHLLHQPGRELQAGTLGRLLNHDRQPCPAQRPDDQRVVDYLCQPSTLRRCTQNSDRTVATTQTGLSSPKASRSNPRKACCSRTPVRVRSSSADRSPPIH
jgi:hypothetical protein